MVYKMERKSRVLEEKPPWNNEERQNKLNWPTIGIDAGIGTQATLLQASALRQQSVISAPRIFIGCVM